MEEKTNDSDVVEDTTNKEPQRPKTIFINGGAGRALAAIPALEKHLKNNPESIIICETFDGFFKNNPIIWDRTYPVNHKNLFTHYIKDREVLSPEPYRRWEYYNQKANIAQCFDLEINGAMSDNLSDYKANIVLTSVEELKGQQVINDLKKASGYNSFVVLQPFGRGTQISNDIIFDESGRSIGYNDMVNLIRKISEKHGVILMSEIDITLPADLKAGRPTADLREWASIIKASNYFIGCDSVGQHIAFSYDKPSTIICGGTYPVNVSYPNVSNNFKIIDLGKNKRKYSSIRIGVTEDADMNNESLMKFNDDTINVIVSDIPEPPAKTETTQSQVEKGSCSGNCSG